MQLGIPWLERLKIPEAPSPLTSVALGRFRSRLQMLKKSDRPMELLRPPPSRLTASAFVSFEPSDLQPLRYRSPAPAPAIRPTQTHRTRLDRR
jgi:hypothetical protein